MTQKPPNYRMASSTEQTERKACGFCHEFDRINRGGDVCNKHNRCVRQHWVCDDFKVRGA